MSESGCIEHWPWAEVSTAVFCSEGHRLYHGRVPKDKAEGAALLNMMTAAVEEIVRREEARPQWVKDLDAWLMESSPHGPFQPGMFTTRMRWFRALAEGCGLTVRDLSAIRHGEVEATPEQRAALEAAMGGES